MSSLICQRSLTKATSGMNTALQRMSTGLKINSAKDDAAGCAISSKMDYKLSSYSVAQDNAQMGQSMLDTASGSLSVMNNMLQRMRDLSEQAANGTYGKEERQAMQAEVDALTKELYRIKNSTDFNGKKVLGEEDVKMLSESEAKEQGYTVVKTAQELKDALVVNDPNCKVMLFSDINLDDLGLDANGSNWTAVGNATDTFQGTFDGNGYTISNLKINTKKTDIKTDGTDDRQGLFGFTSKSTIQNVNLENVDIKGNKYTGGLVGLNHLNSTITNCSVSGNVTGNYGVGGLVGLNHVNSTITNCSATGDVTGTGDRIGGLVGLNQNNSTITSCFSTGNVIGEGNYTGGLVGSNINVLNTGYTTKSVIENCWCSGSVTGTTNVGGFVGYNRESDIINCSYDKTSIGQANDIGLKEGTSSQINPEPLIDSKTNPLLKSSDKDICKVNLQVGINADSDSQITVDSGFKMGFFKVNLTSEESARKSIDKLDAMMAKVNAKQLDIGATSNRLASTMEFQSVQMSALTSANSLIKDADIAKESASYIKNQILQQTTATLLATANQNPSIALSLV